MNIGNPSLADVFRKMKGQGCERILAIPLFSQYASSSTGSAMSSIFSLPQEVRNLPEIRTIKQYYDNPDYIAALATSINLKKSVEHLPAKSFQHRIDSKFSI